MYKVVDAGLRLYGGFTFAATRLSPFISSSLAYTPTGALVTLTRTASYVSVADSQDQVAFANRLHMGLDIRKDDLRHEKHSRLPRRGSRP